MAVNDLETHPDDAKIAALYREAASPDTPAALDSAVLRNAREAIAPRAPRVAWWMPWRVPLAFAAVAVLSVSVVLVIEREGGEPLRLEPPQASYAPPPPAEPAAPAPMQAPDSAASQAASGATATAKPEPPTGSPQAADRTDALAKRNVEESARAERKASADTASREKKTDAREKAVLRDAAPAEQAKAAAAARGPDAEAMAVAPSGALSAPAPATMAAPPPPVAALPERAPPAMGQAKPAPAPAAKPYVPPAPKPLAAQRRAPELDARDPAVATLIAELDQRPPAEWRERIAALRREDRAALADALVAEFKRRFPEEPPPPER